MEANGLALDRVDPRGWRLVPQQILGALVVLEGLIRQPAPLQPQALDLLDPGLEHRECVPLCVPCDVAKARLGLVEAAVGDLDPRLLKPELEPSLQAGRAARDQLVHVHAELGREVLEGVA